MRNFGLVLIVALAAMPLFAQNDPHGPSNPKAQKAYREGQAFLGHHQTPLALDSFKHADKIEGGHCVACQQQIIKCAVEVSDWKVAEAAARAMVGEAQNPTDVSGAHYTLGIVLMDEAQAKHKAEIYARAHDEMAAALAVSPNFALAVYFDGLALARSNQDAAAKPQFERYVALAPANDELRHHALRFIREPEMARANIAPSFSVTTLDGQRFSLDDLRGKVVLLDFRATWCGPCRQALPHMQAIAKKFKGQPLVILSVSVDDDENKWKSFVAKNAMTWLNYCDGGFEGSLATLFKVYAIPHTFTIDADGVLQNEAIGDAAIEGKLKKLIARAQETPAPPTASQSPAGTTPSNGK
jgi:thiol-disulfide isomerase/thioredoxin